MVWCGIKQVRPSEQGVSANRWLVSFWTAPTTMDGSDVQEGNSTVVSFLILLNGIWKSTSKVEHFGTDVI